MKIVTTCTSAAFVHVIILCIFNSNGANIGGRHSSENTRNLGISLNITILDVSATDQEDKRHILNGSSELSTRDRQIPRIGYNIQTRDFHPGKSTSELRGSHHQPDGLWEQRLPLNPFHHQDVTAGDQADHHGGADGARRREEHSRNASMVVDTREAAGNTYNTHTRTSSRATGPGREVPRPKENGYRGESDDAGGRSSRIDASSSGYQREDARRDLGYQDAGPKIVSINVEVRKPDEDIHNTNARIPSPWAAEWTSGDNQKEMVRPLQSSHKGMRGDQSDSRGHNVETRPSITPSTSLGDTGYSYHGDNHDSRDGRRRTVNMNVGAESDDRYKIDDRIPSQSSGQSYGDKGRDLIRSGQSSNIGGNRSQDDYQGQKGGSTAARIYGSSSSEGDDDSRGDRFVENHGSSKKSIYGSSSGNERDTYTGDGRSPSQGIESQSSPRTPIVSEERDVVEPRRVSVNSFHHRKVDGGEEQNNLRDNRPSKTYGSSSSDQRDDYIHDSNGSNNGRASNDNRHGRPKSGTTSPGPHQDIHQSRNRISSQSSGRGGYNDNGEVVRHPGQSGYQGDEEGVSSTVDRFDGNANADADAERPQNSRGLRSREKATVSMNGYSEIDRRFDGNGESWSRDNIRGSGNAEVDRAGTASGFREAEGEEDKRRRVVNLGDSGRRKTVDESSFAEDSPRYSTVQTTIRHHHERTTSSPRPHDRSTTIGDKSTAGCYLPRQPRDGHYDLGGCDSPCDKETGDLVPNTSVLTYTCDDGFVRNGIAVSVCLNDSWYMPPSCLRTCPPLVSTSVDITCKLRGSKVPCDGRMEPGTRATLACKPSYKIPLTEDPAYREISCLTDGLWDQRLFRCLPKCGTTIAHGSTLVVNGFTAKVGVFPWHVGIYEKKSRHVYEQICAGTLINSNLVVSAAHCFFDESTNSLKATSGFSAAAGKHFRSWDAVENYAEKSDIANITLGSRYIGARGNYAQDIALLELKTPFQLSRLVSPVCLDWDNVLEREHLQSGRYGKTVGWGKTVSGQPSEELQEINVPFVSFDQCVADVPKEFRGFITPDKFCAGYRNGSSLCEGDSGGGLCFESDGLWYLRGIVSISPVRNHSCDYHAYTAFTYFSHFREWIRNAFLKF